LLREGKATPKRNPGPKEYGDYVRLNIQCLMAGGKNSPSGLRYRLDR
jgi:hypothetical protein